MSQSALSTEARRTLVRVLDQIIPSRPDGALPGAGALGVAEYVCERLGDATGPIEEALAELDEIASQRGASEFGELQAEDRTALLNDTQTTHPAFLPILLFHTYSGYYQDLRVIEALGLEPRPPHPKGYELEQGDLSLLEAVRVREKLYREA